jgi:hypothetical protein
MFIPHGGFAQTRDHALMSHPIRQTVKRGARRFVDFYPRGTRSFDDPANALVSAGVAGPDFLHALRVIFERGQDRVQTADVIIFHGYLQ